MPRRTLVTLLAVAALIVLAAIVPRTPPGRAWLLARLTGALEGSGIHLSYQRSAGNPWTGVELHGAQVQAPGIDLRVQDLSVSYFLPSLITGELPLSLTLSGVRGSLEASQMKGLAGGGGGGLPVTPVLQELTVSDASVSVAQVPYTLPSGAVSDIRIHQHGHALDLQAHLRTADGSADASGVLDLSGPSFDGQVTSADVTLARHWFPGATGGTVSGPLHVGSDGIRGDFQLQDGSLDAIGLHPTGIRGQVQLRYPLITATLQGTALGGPVRAHGTVNVAARHWQAHAQGTPALAAAAAWLLRSSLPSGSALPLSGRASTTLDLSGWTAVHVNGSADGSGAFAGLPMDGLQSDFSYDSHRGVTVQASGRVAGGGAVATVAATPSGTRVETKVQQARPAAGQSVDASLQLDLGPSGTGGKLTATDRATLPDRDATVSLDAGLNRDGWQGVVSGHDSRGATLEGAVALAGRRLSGELRAHRLTLPGVGAPATLALRADGPLSALPLTLTLGGDAPLRPAAGPESLAADLRGRVTATLKGSSLTGLDATLGPLTASGSVDLAPFAGSLRLALAGTRLDGPVGATVALENGTLAFGGKALEPGGTLTLGTVTAGPLTIRPGPLALTAGSGGSGPVRLADSSGQLTVALGPRGVRASFAGLPLALAGTPVTLDGHLALPLAGGLAGIEPDLTLSRGDARLSVRPSADRLLTDLTVPAGTALGPVTLAQPLEASGTVDPAGLTAELAGTLGDLPVQAALTSTGPGPALDLTAGSGPDTLHGRLDRRGWRLQGALDLGRLAAPLGLPLQGRLAGDLRADTVATPGAGAPRYQGRATVTTSAPLAARMTLQGTGAELRAEAHAQLAGQALSAQGALLPSPTLSASLGPFGPIALRSGRLTGSGTLPARPLAPALTLRALPWSIAGTLAPLDVRLSLGRGRVHLQGDRLAASLDLPLDYAGTALVGRVATAGTGPPDAFGGAPSASLGAGLDALPIRAGLTATDGSTLLTAHGNAGSLALTGSLPASLLAAPLPSVLRPGGSVSLDGEVGLAQGPRYRLQASWRAAAATVGARLSGTGTRYRLSAQGGGLTLQAAPDSASLTADGAHLADLLASVPGDARLDGALALKAGRWSGALHLRADAPASVSADLAAQAGTLHLQATADAGPLALRASGTLRPQLSVQTRATAFGDAVALSAHTEGAGSSLRVVGSLATQAVRPVPWLQLPARRATLRWNPHDGSLHGTGDGLTLDGTLAGLQASLRLPFTLLGRPQSLDLALRGPITAPDLHGTVSGPVLHGTLSGTPAAGLEAELVASRAALSAPLGAAGGLLGTDVGLTGHLATDGSWTADVSSALASAAAGVALRASLHGEGARYQGTVSFAPPGTGADGPTLATVALKGRAASAVASLDLGTLDAAALGRLLGVPLELHQATGQARLATAPLSASLSADVSGTVAGRSLTLEGHAGGGAGVDLTLGYAGVRAALTGGAKGGLQLALSGPEKLSLQGSATLDGAPAVDLRGTVAGLAASLQAKAQPAAGSGSLNARIGGATLTVQVSPSGHGTAMQVRVHAPRGSLAPLGTGLAGSLEGSATLAGSSLTLERLTASSSLGPTPWSLDLSGPAYPNADLSGSLAAPGWQASAQVRLQGPPQRLQLQATLGQLALDARARGTRLERLSLDGATRLAAVPGGVDLRAHALSWTEPQGFSGSADLQLPGSLARLPGTVDVALTGSGALAVAARAGPATQPWLTARAQLAAQPLADRSLQGTVTVDAPVARWAGLPGPAELRLRGSPTLAGSWSHPVLDGALELGGALQASGTLHLEPGDGTLDLSGRHAVLKGHLAAGGWTASVALTGASLAPFVPALKDAHATLRADLSGGAGGVQGTVRSMTLSAPGASLTGTASLDRGVRVALQAKADLAAMALPGPPLQGLLHGPLVLVAPSLGDLAHGDLVAVLDVARLGTSGMGGSVDGTLQVGGTPVDPSLTASLQGNGQVQGHLRVDAAPARGRLDVTSTIGYHGLATDLSLSVRPKAVQASGQLRVGGASATLSTDAQGALALQGSGQLAGWRARVAADAGSATLQGPLSALGIGAGGSLDLRLGGRPWLQGGVQGARLRGVDLGDLRLASPRPGATVTLQGPHLTGTLDPTRLGWHLALTQQPLPGALQLSGEASGSGATGTAELRLGGTLAGAPVAVKAQASNRDGTSLTADGPLLGGALRLQASLSGDGQWSGTLGLKGAALGGLGADVQGTVGGAATDPALHATVDLTGAVRGSAHVDASASSARLDATLAGSVLGGTLTLQGTVLPGVDLTVAAAPGATSQGQVRLFDAAGALRADGRLQLASGPLRVRVTGSGRDTPIGVQVRAPALPGLAFQGELPSRPPLALVTGLASQGLTLHGARRTKGTLVARLRPAPRVALHQVSLDYGGTTLSADGSLGPGNGALQGALTLPSALPVDHVGGTTLPYRATLTGGRLSLRSASDLGTLRADVDPGAGTASLHADLHTLDASGASASGSARVDLTLAPSQGASGSVAIDGVRVQRAGLPALTLSANAHVGKGTVSGNADIGSQHGGVHVDGSWGLAGVLPASLAPGASSGGSLEARVSTFQLASLPTVARLAPHLRGTVSGIVRVRNDNVVAQLVAPDFTVATTSLPLDLQLSGPFRDLNARLKLGDSLATATVTPGEARGLLTFRRFPAQVLAEANVGAMDVKAEVDGLLRFDLPFGHLADSYLRLATEHVKLERSGVLTTGNLALAYQSGTLSIDQASFQGRGTWQAQGTVGADKLDLRLSADGADFGPLLGLVPLFARYGVGANGTVSLVAQGTPAKPHVTLTARGLDAEVAGTRYRLDHADVALNGSALTASATVEGVAPLGGSLDAHGSAKLTLTPLQLSNTDFRFTGSAQVPVFGRVSAISGGITQPSGSAPRLAVSGTLGRPFTIQGSLAPFDVTLKGQGLDLKAAPLLVSSSSVNANVEMKATRAGLALSGELDANEIRMNLGPQTPAGSNGAPGSGGPASATGGGGGTTAPAPAGGAASGQTGAGAAPSGPASPAGAAAAPPSSGAAARPSGSASATAASGSPATPASGPSSRTGSRAALHAVLFDHLHLRAPQRVLLDASFGSMEASLDLTLDGSAASPQLSGSAQALRGSLRFGGRDFTLDRAVATFQPSRGVYPSLDVEAHTTFDKRRVLSGTPGVSFAAPRQGNTFTVTLSFSGQVQPSQKPGAPVTFDINPTLTSNAEVQTGSNGTTSSPRALSDSELLSLITLGRLEVKPQLAGQAGIGTAVAQSAIDTAVNVLVVNELQSALSKALGLDVVEINTTPLSSLLDNSGQPFGVSLRVGGYLTPQLFASYRLGNVSGSGENYAFTNEVTLSYDLGPLNVDLSGQLSFPDASTPGSAVPQLGVGLRYAFTPSIGLEAGVDLSNVNQQARFGVSFRW